MISRALVTTPCDKSHLCRRIDGTSLLALFSRLRILVLNLALARHGTSRQASLECRDALAVFVRDLSAQPEDFKLTNAAVTPTLIHYPP